MFVIANMAVAITTILSYHDTYKPTAEECKQKIDLIYNLVRFQSPKL